MLKEDSNQKFKIIMEEFMFKLISKYKPAGDQPVAIDKLVKGINEGKKSQVLLGATGTGKTFAFLLPMFENIIHI